MYFTYLYENRIMKLVEIILTRGGKRRRTMEEMNLPKVHCKDI
jgi:hypothetical protein